MVGRGFDGKDIGELGFVNIPWHFHPLVDFVPSWRLPPPRTCEADDARLGFFLVCRGSFVSGASGKATPTNHAGDQ